MSHSKYPGYNPDDTFWDEHQRKQGLMTNNEFFTSNSKGGFYEGMEWNGKDWIPDAISRKSQYEKEEVERNKPCDWCGEVHIGNCY